jgi:hypothetical protein
MTAAAIETPTGEQLSNEHLSNEHPSDERNEHG